MWLEHFSAREMAVTLRTDAFNAFFRDRRARPDVCRLVDAVPSFEEFQREFRLAEASAGGADGLRRAFVRACASSVSAAHYSLAVKTLFLLGAVAIERRRSPSNP